MLSNERENEREKQMRGGASHEGECKQGHGMHVTGRCVDLPRMWVSPLPHMRSHRRPITCNHRLSPQTQHLRLEEKGREAKGAIAQGGKDRGAKRDERED
jgi:hypothetical protein